MTKQEPDHSPLTPGCVAAILPAAGSGQRFGSHRNKLFAELQDAPLWTHAVSRLSASRWVGRIVMAVSAVDEPVFRIEHAKLLDRYGIELVPGGEERTNSVQAGLDAVAKDDQVRFVAIHDAARPLRSRQHEIKPVGNFLDAIFYGNACHDGLPSSCRCPRRQSAIASWEGRHQPVFETGWWCNANRLRAQVEPCALSA